MEKMFTAEDIRKIYTEPVNMQGQLSDDIKRLYAKLQSKTLPRRELNNQRDACDYISSSQREFLDDLHMEQLEQM